jgi:hypothetical protein
MFVEFRRPQDHKKIRGGYGLERHVPRAGREWVPGAKLGSEDIGGRLSLQTTKPARTQYKNGKEINHNVHIDI